MVVFRSIVPDMFEDVHQKQQVGFQVQSSMGLVPEYLSYLVSPMVSETLN